MTECVADKKELGNFYISFEWKEGGGLKYKRIDGPTPGGGVYSEIYYFDADGNTAEEDAAGKCVIRECGMDGEIISETWGICNSTAGC